ncbi:hypothetical protein [Hymenobacter crusticola]|uniref:Antitoxin VbhA domain-containing protein n=1 Tax=Hymenobacter crusticola TaxID=1770526 RepID=A0A243WDC1_9BACT|nr:hypothetical protein [Hymenobacter crusticola]OUJ73435.1 hypothetical protein BXP70_13560 [Hymenobacter crusticola]
MEDAKFPLGQRSRDQRQVYIQAARNMLLASGPLGKTTEGLFARYVAGELTLQGFLGEMGKQSTG